MVVMAAVCRGARTSVVLIVLKLDLSSTPLIFEDLVNIFSNSLTPQHMNKR